MYLDDKISKEAYDDKYSEIVNKWDKCEEEKHLFSDCVLSQKNIADKMKLIRQKLKGADVLDEFDRVVFESIVEKVVVGDMEEDGTADPYKLTFVLKGMDDRSIPYARDRYMNLREKTVQTTRRSFKMSDNHDLLNDNDMCSFSGYEVDDVCSNNDIDACGDGMFVGVFTRCKLEQRT